MKKLSFRLSALVVLTLVFSSCAGFKPKPVANASFHERVMTKADGKLTIVYYKEGKDGIGSRVDRVGADGKTTTTEWHFKAQPFAK